MSKFRAILVEDEPSSADATVEALNAAGFDVTVYNDAVSAVTHGGAEHELIDLLVLDRRLPLRHGEAPDDAVGDELLTSMLQRYSDLVAVVFSGHTGSEHLQFATADRGVISIAGDEEVLDRVRLFEKGQSLEFDGYIARISQVLTQLEDIQIICDDIEQLSTADKRILRRVARELRGASIEAEVLVGGLTDSPVWLCSIHGEHAPTARVVAKGQVKSREPGGFQTLCPAQLTAGTVSVVRGFCAGHCVTIQQLVGDEPTPLLTLLGSDPARAGAIVSALRLGLAGVPSGQQANLRLSEIAAPFESWDRMQARAADFGVDVPPGSRIATTVRSAQHGDMHPGNVLASGDVPVLIDFDSQTVGSELIDVVALMLGALFHRDSPLRDGEWPTVAQCSDLMADGFLDNCPAPEFFVEVVGWLRARQRSARELYAVVLAFAVRQLRYGDVIANTPVRERAVAIARWASKKIDET